MPWPLTPPPLDTPPMSSTMRTSFTEWEAEQAARRPTRVAFSWDNLSWWFFERAQVWGEAWTQHFKRQWVAYLLAFALGSLIFKHYSFGLNGSTSLPYSAFIVEKNAPAKRGDFIAFTWHGAGPYPAGTTFLKQLVGLPGDVVREVNREFFVNDTSYGLAKPVSKKGATLDLGPTGTIPPANYYVYATSPDSLDSRYAWTGWISRDQVLGRIVWKF